MLFRSAYPPPPFPHPPMHTRLFGGGGEGGGGMLNNNNALHINNCRDNKNDGTEEGSYISISERPHLNTFVTACSARLGVRNKRCARVGSGNMEDWPSVSTVNNSSYRLFLFVPSSFFLSFFPVEFCAWGRTHGNGTKTA